MIEDNTFNSLNWRSVDWEKLNELISGWTVCGAEPIDYPLTDGAIIYLKDSNGNLAALELGQEPDGESFYIQIAKIPSGAGM